jgi:isoquinoline 1-oxidoreductase
MKSEKITELYFSDVDQPVSTYDRREFLKRLGGGIIIIFSFSELSLLTGCTPKEGEERPDFNAYLHIKEDGSVDCLTGKIEMGQGAITSLGQELAEELEVPLESVKMIMGDTELCPYDAGTWGSLTTRFEGPVIRAAAAEAREVLIDLAAKQLGVPDTQLEASEGTVFDKNDNSKKVSYADLTKGQKIVQRLKKQPELKKSADYEIIGKSMISVDAEDKVTGRAKFAGDIKLPGMVYATIVRPRVWGAKKVSVDASGLDKFEGAELVEEGDLVAVVHPEPEVSTKAVQSVKVEWDEPESKADNETIFKYFVDNITEGDVFEEGGDIAAGREACETVVEAEYHDGYKAHATVETHTATCYFEGDKLTMWASSQTPFGTREALAETFQMPKEKVHLKQIFLGGGFGGKIYNPQAIEAAKIAKLSGKPVQLAYTRREEFMYDYFRPAAVVKSASGVDSDGKLKLWEFDVWCAGSRGTSLFYDIPNNRTRIFNKDGIHPFSTGAWRAPGNNTTTFARESQIDATAHAAGIDPLEFRLNNIKNEEMTVTLKLAADTFGWNKEKPEGHGYGIALGWDAGCLVATIAEVKVDKETGHVQPIRIVCAQDMGQVVNPKGAKEQGEGGTAMGLGYSLTEDIEFDWGRVITRNFDTYSFTKFSMTPKIECVFVDKMDSAPQGGGEPSIITVGGAIANAVFDACGARVNRQPITPERILKALQEVG